MGSARAEAGWAVAATASVFWLVALGVYGLILLSVSASGQWCDIGQRSDTAGRVAVSWMPPGFECHRHDFADGTEYDEHPDRGAEWVDGPGPMTAAFQLFLLATPMAAWVVAGRTADGIARRRDVAEVWVFAGIGLTSLAGVAAAMGSTGLASILLLGGAGLGLLGGTYRWRTRPHDAQRSVTRENAAMGVAAVSTGLLLVVGWLTFQAWTADCRSRNGSFEIGAKSWQWGEFAEVCSFSYGSRTEGPGWIAPMLVVITVALLGAAWWIRSSTREAIAETAEAPQDASSSPLFD